MNKTLQYYDDNAAEFVGGTVNADMSEMYGFFQRYVKSGARILDFGCGSGRDTKYFTEQGYEVDAIDGSKELCKLAAEYTGRPVRQMLFNELNDTEVYDGIWACSSILHVPMSDLPDVLSRIHKALVPGGYLYTSFKYGEFSGDRNGRYFSDLTEENLAKLIADIPEFEIVETAITGDVRPGREDEKWLNVVVKKNTLK